MTLVPIRETTRGHWRYLLPGFGVDAALLTGRHGPCPLCKGGRDRFRFDDRNQDGTWFCSQCGAGDGVSLVMKMAGLDFKAAADELTRRVQGAPPPEKARSRRTDDQRQEAMNRLWALGRPLQVGDPVWRYLTERRGLPAFVLETREIRCVPQARFLPDPKDRSRSVLLPCMIARVRDPDGRPVNVHRTYLTEDGSDKAPYADCRKLMGGALPRGSAIRFGTVSDGRIGVAEGIETALSAAALFNVPTWAMINADNMMAFQPLDDTTTFVFGDADVNYVGQAAAYTLAKRIVLTKKNEHAAKVHIPPLGMDWNDKLREGEQIA